MESIWVVATTTCSASNTPSVFVNVCFPGYLGVFNTCIRTQHTNFQALEIAYEITVAHPIWHIVRNTLESKKYIKPQILTQSIIIKIKM